MWVGWNELWSEAIWRKTTGKKEIWIWSFCKQRKRRGGFLIGIKYEIDMGVLQQPIGRQKPQSLSCANPSGWLK